MVLQHPGDAFASSWLLAYHHHAQARFYTLETTSITSHLKGSNYLPTRH